MCECPGVAAREVSPRLGLPGASTGTEPVHGVELRCATLSGTCRSHRRSPAHREWPQPRCPGTGRAPRFLLLPRCSVPPAPPAPPRGGADGQRPAVGRSVGFTGSQHCYIRTGRAPAPAALRRATRPVLPHPPLPATKAVPLPGAGGAGPVPPRGRGPPAESSPGTSPPRGWGRHCSPGGLTGVLRPGTGSISTDGTSTGVSRCPPAGFVPTAPAGARRAGRRPGVPEVPAAAQGHSGASCPGPAPSRGSRRVSGGTRPAAPPAAAALRDARAGARSATHRDWRTNRNWRPRRPAHRRASLRPRSPRRSQRRPRPAPGPTYPSAPSGPAGRSAPPAKRRCSGALRAPGRGWGPTALPSGGDGGLVLGAQGAGGMKGLGRGMTGWGLAGEPGGVSGDPRDRKETPENDRRLGTGRRPQGLAEDSWGQAGNPRADSRCWGQTGDVMGRQTSQG